MFHHLADSLEPLEELYNKHPKKGHVITLFTVTVFIYLMFKEP